MLPARLIPQAIDAVYHDYFVKTAFGINGKRHSGRGDIGAHHALHAHRKRGVEM